MFFGDMHGQYPITTRVLAKRTNEYRRWVAAYACATCKVPIVKAEKGVSKEDAVRPYLQRMERPESRRGFRLHPPEHGVGQQDQVEDAEFPTNDQELPHLS